MTNKSILAYSTVDLDSNLANVKSHMSSNMVQTILANRSWAIRITNIAMICALFMICIVMDTKTPFHRVIQVEDFHFYAFPHKHETLHYHVMVPVSLAVGTCIMFLAAVIQYKTTSIRSGSFHWLPYAILDTVDNMIAVMFCFLLTSLLCMTVKMFYGRPRPHYFNVCFPTKYAKSMESTGLPYVPSVVNFTCEDQVHPNALEEARLSFPSGHTSTMVSLSVLPLWILQQRIDDALRDRCDLQKSYLYNIWKSTRALYIGVILVPSIMVALQRTRVYRHHVEDVIAGGILGLAVTAIYIKYFYRIPNNSEKKMESETQFTAVHS